MTGLPVWYILKANLRIDGGEFEKTLQDDNGLTTGRLDTRFSGPNINPLSESADYDPQSWWRTAEGVRIFFHELGGYLHALWEMRRSDVRTT